MSTKRAKGASAQTLIKFQDDYDTMAAGDYFRVPFTKNELGGERSLIDDPVLGYGRDGEEPLEDVLTVTGDLTVPIDTNYFGLYLKALFGAPVSTQVAAKGTIEFAANPIAASTITINGVTYTFIAGASAGTDIQIKGTLSLTLDEIVTVLNASGNAAVNVATYSHPFGKNHLLVTHDTVGAAGNAFTLAASFAKPSAKTLEGGGYEHVFQTGEEDLPCFTMERGNPDIDRYRLYPSVKANTLALDFQRSGAATAVIGMIAKGMEDITEESQGGNPEILPFSRISQFKGYVKSAGDYVGNLTSSSMNHSNNMEGIQTIRDDDRIDGADEGITSVTGQLNIRLSDSGILASAEAREKVDLEYGYKLSAGQQLRFAIHRATLSLPKDPVTGPGGIEVALNYQASRDQTSGKIMTITLVNNLDGTQYE